MKRTAIFSIIFALLTVFSLMSQHTLAQQPISLSLKQAQEIAAENAYNVRLAETDIETARQQVKELTATGLPQVNGSIGYNDNIGLPVQLVPGDFFGQPGQDIEVQFGTKYSANAGISVNQLLFSGSYLVGLQAANAFLEKSREDKAKSVIDIRKTVAEAYFLVLATEEGINIIDSSLSITRKLTEETRITFENGMVEETDFDQLNLMVSNLEVSKSNSLNMLKIARSYLNFHLGYPENTEVILTQDIASLIEELKPLALIEENFDLFSNIDYRIMRRQQELAALQLKQQKSLYLPSLSAFLNYQTQAQRANWDFFDSKGKWYSSSVWGVNMSIPIFSSGERRAKVNQARAQVEKTLVAGEQVERSLKIQYKNTADELKDALLTYGTSNQNKELSEKIFRRTGIKYQEGISGSLDLLNTQRQYLDSQSQYINAALNVLNKSIALQSMN